MKKYGFVYLWRDKKHKRYYVGSHWGLENDGYVCSSRWMRNAYRLRPNDFKRRILARVYSSKQDLLMEEGRWLSMMKQEEINGVRYYNRNITTKPGHWTAIPNYDKTISEKISINTKKAMWREDIRSKYLDGLGRRDNRSSDKQVRLKRSASLKNTFSKLTDEQRREKTRVCLEKREGNGGKKRLFKNGRFKLAQPNSCKWQEMLSDGWSVEN